MGRPVGRPGRPGGPAGGPGGRHHAGVVARVRWGEV